ncbi:MAG: cation diffusion facilitator family transporter [Promethearchaeota archaeon]
MKKKYLKKKTKQSNIKQKKNKKSSKNKIDSTKYYKQEKIAFRLSMFMVVMIFLIMFITSIFTNSIAFLTEFLDSILDFLILGFTYFSLKKSSKPADFKHMFGHKKINSLIGVLESFITIIFYASVIYRSIILTLEIILDKIVYEVVNPIPTAFSIIITLVINSIITTKLLKIGKETKNTVIISQAINFKGDFLRNIVVVVGLIGANFSFEILDPLIALIFSIKIIIDSYDVLKKGLNEILDYNPILEKDLEEIKRKILEIEGINSMHSITLSSIGNDLHFHLKLEYDSDISAYSVDKINNIVKNTICSYFNEYFCDVNIEIISNKAQKDLDKVFPFYEIFDIVKYATLKNKDIKEIHNVNVDVLEDMILIQLHIKLPAELSLEEAHNLVSNYENSIKEIIGKETSIVMPIQLISHIEPLESSKKIHKHKLNMIFSDYIKEILVYTLNKYNYVKKFSDLIILKEKDGYYMFLKVYFDKNLEIEVVHSILNKIEYELRNSIPDIKRCILHSEPV